MNTTECKQQRTIGPISLISTDSAYRRDPLPPWVDLRLDSNEGPPLISNLPPKLGPPRTVERLNRYPQRGHLEQQIARRLDISPNRVLVTAGGDEAIDRICRAYLCSGREIILPVPTFEMIERYAALAGAEITPVPWPNGPFPTNEILSIACDRTSVLSVVSPNNPTGAIATSDDIAKLATHLPNVLIMVDLAYVEFADNDLTACALKYPNCVVVRSMSKAWGLAGLRVGYAVGAPGIVASLRAAGGPYAVSAPSLAIASEAFEASPETLRRRTIRIREERNQLVNLLTRLGESPSPSQANFVWSRFRRATWVEQALRSLGIAVRRFTNKPNIANHLRITCPGDETLFARLCHALETILAPEAILFDLDGVLADVSDSYRTAIMQTAEAFGVSLTPEDIAAAKAQGNANNDWDLTTRLLNERGHNVSHDDVKQRFEAIYQGTTTNTGLWQRERTLVTREWLANLSRRFSLGIVTGRPRVDAERFLRTTALRDYFKTLICMEDAPAKPSPEPVRLAMQRLNATRAWLLGDTPDDMLAARAAGVLPIGVIAPGEERLGRQALNDAGAAAILNQADQLENLPS